MAEANDFLDDLITPEGAEVESVEPEVQAEAVGADAEEAQEEPQESRSNQRIRQLVEEKNELARRIEAMEGLKDQVKELYDKQAAAENPPEPEAQPPEFMEDPKGYIDSQQQAIAKKLQEMESSSKDLTAKQEQEANALRFQYALTSDETEFRMKQTDYYNTLNHIRAVRTAELTDLGMKEDQAKQVIGAEELRDAAAALNNGKSPAEYAYNRAKRLGYTAATNKDAELDEKSDRLAAAQNAQSMGGSGISQDKVEADPEEQGWDPIKNAFKEIFGEDLR